MSEERKTAMDLEMRYDDNGEIKSISLYDKVIAQGKGTEVILNQIPFNLRKVSQGNGSQGNGIIMQGERFVDNFTGYALKIGRYIGIRSYAKHESCGIEYWIKRVKAEPTYPEHGPGDGVIEAPLYADTISVLNVNWNFWGDDTRMIFSSTHSAGPVHEYGHCGYENDTPENCKKYMRNIRRRIYPGTMVIHGGLFYSVKTQEWIAITCRQANMGYIVNIDDAGKGVSFDFSIHKEIQCGELLRLPEIKIYYGRTGKEMQQWLTDYVTQYYPNPPEWIFRSAWRNGLAWDNEPSWTAQAEKYRKEIEEGVYSALKQSLVTNRPVSSGTKPYGYMPDPNHGSIYEFKQMCGVLKEKKMPFIIWMSHSGMAPGGVDIDDDWFIRGIDGGMTISWGEDPRGMYLINPGHPGYIEYTKKWIRFYIKECGAKGIFLDCLGWHFPCDFKKREFMRNPGDTNLMAIKFVREIYSCIKECDPEAILMGEGTSIDMPVDIFSVITNEKHAIDGMGPRDFILSLNDKTRRIAVDPEPFYCPGSGVCTIQMKDEFVEHNRFITRYLKENGTRIQILSGDVSICDDMVFVPYDKETLYSFQLKNASEICEIITGRTYHSDESGNFMEIPFGFYRFGTEK